MTDHLTKKLWAGFASNRQDDFLVSPSRRISYRQAQAGIKAWLGVFDKAGLNPGDRLVIRTDRDDVAAIGFIAALVDGIVPVLLEGSCPDARLQGIASTVEPKLVMSDQPIPDLPQSAIAVDLIPDTAPKRFSMFSGSANRAAFGVADGPAARAPRLPKNDGLAYLIFTSGTTSAPSGVQISRSNLAANLSTLTRLFGYGRTSRIFNDMILAHADGIVQGPLLAAWTQSAILRAGGFDIKRIEDWLGAVRQLRATHVLTVPTVWSMIDKYAAHDDYFDAPECEMLMTVAAKMPDVLRQRIEKRFSRPLVNHYGLSETVASALYSGAAEGLGAPDSIGHPVDCEARIADDLDEGELQLRGNNVFSGYWKNPERTAESFTPDGWFRTGDLVRKRPDGSYDILGRLKTVIMSGGVLIRPDEIDEAMQRHPDVIESATVGIEDDVFGEIGITLVTLGKDVDETALTEHLRGYVEPRKVSKRIFAVAEIPRGPSGKPKLDALRREIATRLAATDDGTAQTVQNSELAFEKIVIELATTVFRVPEESVSASATPDDIAAWDSFTHLNLIMAIETKMNIRIPASRLSRMRKLGDIIEAVEELA